MVKFYENTFSYDFAWPAVTLAYFLRYPNPYSTHVLATDTLSRYLDPATGKLHTVRLHLKRGKLPAAVARFLPKIKESYILERSVVDVRNQTMETETRNLDWEGVISVVESQVYTPSAQTEQALDGAADCESTDVKLTVKISSRVGSNAKGKMSDAASSGLWSSWTTGSIQKSIEIVGMKRMREGLGRSKEGMKVVLEGLREKGLLVAMHERRERKLADRREGIEPKWKDVWRKAAGTQRKKIGEDSDD